MKISFDYKCIVNNYINNKDIVNRNLNPLNTENQNIKTEFIFYYL